ncbi:MAG: LPXTG cell wall anchor domain-containing protein [Ilumatobacteraceae bacterium]
MTDDAPTADAVDPSGSAPVIGSDRPASVTPSTDIDPTVVSEPIVTTVSSEPTSGSLPMTGSSIALVGLAASLAIGGLVILIARRRREETAA